MEERAYIPVINKVRCTGCGDCTIACPVDVQLRQQDQPTILIITNGKCIVKHPEACDGCGNCVEACSQEAIRIDLAEAQKVPV